MLDSCQVYEHFMANTESQARKKPLQDRKRRQERCTLLAFRNLERRSRTECVNAHFRARVPAQGGTLQYHGSNSNYVQALSFGGNCFPFLPSSKFRIQSLTALLLSNTRWIFHCRKTLGMPLFRGCCNKQCLDVLCNLYSPESSDSFLHICQCLMFLRKLFKFVFQFSYL